MKTFKLLSMTLFLLVMLSACNLPGKSILPTQRTSQHPYDPASTMTVNFTPGGTATAAQSFTPAPPNTPVWSAYHYTCQLVTGGGDMTMNLAWFDRSNGEEGYRVYRDEQIIATLTPNSTTYVDTTFVAAGTSLSYSVEAFNIDWQVSTSTITYGCQ